METTELTNPDTIDRVLQILSWCVIAFAATWLVTSIIGYLHRRAYNLTHAESGHSKNIKPDFLTVDKAKRQDAIDRGKAYDAVLDAREAAARPSPTVEKVGLWARFVATTAALLGLVATIVGTMQKVSSIQEGVAELSSWVKLVELVSQNKAGTIIALAVIGANIIVVVKKLNKPVKE